MLATNGSSPRVWDEAASTYDEQRCDDPVYTSSLDIATGAVSSRRGGIVLDAGCGTGMTTLPLLPCFDTVVAADYSHESLKILGGKIHRGRLCCLRADLRSLPFPDDTFDAVLCANALQHFAPGESQSGAAAELIRVARPGAPIVVTVHHYSREKQRLGWIKEGKPGQAGIDYIYRFTMADLARLFPGSRIVALGFPRLGRIPKVSRQIQNLASRCAGRLAATLELGHMLMSTFTKS